MTSDPLTMPPARPPSMGTWNVRPDWHGPVTRQAPGRNLGEEGRLPGFLRADNNSQHLARSAIAEGIVGKAEGTLRHLPSPTTPRPAGRSHVNSGKSLRIPSAVDPPPGTNSFTAAEWPRGPPVTSAPPIIAYAGVTQPPEPTNHLTVKPSGVDATPSFPRRLLQICAGAREAAGTSRSLIWAFWWQSSPT